MEGQEGVPPTPRRRPREASRSFRRNGMAIATSWFVHAPARMRRAAFPPAAKPGPAEAIRRLVDLYTAWDKREEGEKRRAKLEEGKENE